LKYFKSIQLYTVHYTLYIMAVDFVTTIDSDDEVSNYGGESSRPVKSKKAEDEELDPDFEFDFGGGGSAGIDLWGGDEVRVGDKGKDVSPVQLDFVTQLTIRRLTLTISLRAGQESRSRRTVSVRERGRRVTR
jgi:hypothetical protein